MLKQLSIFVENKHGRLAEITTILHDAKIDIRALSIADTTHFGILRLIVSNTDLAESILKEAGFTVSQTDVIAIAVEDRPGGLSEVLCALRDAGVSVEYMYTFVNRDVKAAYVILRVDKNDAALATLAKTGVKCLEK